MTKEKAKTISRLKVIGVGGSGSNTISRMMKQNIKGVELISFNTDAQDLRKKNAHLKLRIGKKIAQGLGSGMNPKIGKMAARESISDIEKIIGPSQMVFITCGLGGGTGSGAIPVIAELLKKMGILAIAVVTLPFSFEGKERKKIALRAFRELREKVDTLIVIPNDRLLKVVPEKTPLEQAFMKCDEVLMEAVRGISDLVTKFGILNLDFADIKAVMSNSGPALFGLGKAKGQDRAKEAAEKAISSPLIRFSPKGARKVLFNVAGNGNFSLSEVKEIADIIKKRVSPKARVIFGAGEDKQLEKGELKVTVIATGFREQ